MRGSSWVMVSVLALALAGCSPRQKAATPPPAAPLAPPAAVAQQAPAAPTAAAQDPAGPPDAPPAQSMQTAQLVQTAPPQPYHFSTADYAAREQRISALIANAESRDTSGETQYLEEDGRRQRRACASKACVEHSYAAEEARLRKWEGSGDIR